MAWDFPFPGMTESHNPLYDVVYTETSDSTGQGGLPLGLFKTEDVLGGVLKFLISTLQFVTVKKAVSPIWKKASGMT